MNDISEKQKRNYAYFHLVDQSQPNDFVGMIAYSIYKQTKIAYIRKFRDDHRGVAPTEDDLREWQLSQCSTNQIDLYKKYAANMITAFTNAAIDTATARTQQEESNRKTRHEKLERKEQEVLDREKQLKQREDKVSKREAKVKKMEQICPANKSQVGAYFIGVSQGLVATLVYLLVAIIIFVSTKWPIDFVNYFINSVDKNTP